MSLLLSRSGQPGNCTVTLCHSRTRDLRSHCLQADILVAAVGRPEMITADMVKEGAVVIDVGITRVEDPSAKRGYRSRERPLCGRGPKYAGSPPFREASGP